MFKVGYSQNGIPTYSLHYKNFFIVSGKNIDCWTIKGTSFNGNFGTSHFEYLFNEEYGFVRLEWISYDKGKAIFELDNIQNL